MDGSHFDDLVRAVLGGGSPRRLLLRLSALPLAGGFAAFLMDDDESAARKRKHKNKNKTRKKRRDKARDVAAEGPCGDGSGPANRCTKNKHCCTRHCDKRKGRCRCLKDGQRCSNDRLCCPSRTGRTCQEGTCQPGTPAACAETCAGCCDGESCLPGDEQAACGVGGGACESCGEGAVCENGVCQQEPVCVDCPGCCDGAGACQPGTADAACGMGGEACQECEDPRFCADGICTSPPACGDVCAGGCLYGSVQEAIEFAEDGDTITICPGTYTENLTIAKSLTLIGRVQGSDPATDVILDGGGAGPVVVVSAGTVSLETVRITGGSATLGGGIANSGTLVLSGCTVSGNTAGEFGGGVFNGEDATLTLSDCTISGNTAELSGGGILNNTDARLTLNNCTVSGNTAGDFGGGIYNGGTAMLEADTTVTGNHADDDGGGIFSNGISGGGMSTCDGSSSVSGNFMGPPPGEQSDCVAVNGGSCGTC